MSTESALVDLLVGSASGVFSGLIVAALTQNNTSEGRKSPDEQLPPDETPRRRSREPSTPPSAGSDEDWWVWLGLSAFVLTATVGLYVSHYSLVQSVILAATTAALAFILTIYIYRRRHGGASLPRTKLLGFYCVLMGLGILSAFLVRTPLLWSRRIPMAKLQEDLHRDGVFGLGLDAFWVLAYQVFGVLMLVVAILLASYEAFRILAQINTYLEARPYRMWSWISRRRALGVAGAAAALFCVVASFALTSGWLASHLPRGEDLLPATNQESHVTSHQ